MGVTVVIILTLLPARALLPKARAGCDNSARPDPCGGPPARAVPTATGSRFKVSAGSILRRGGGFEDAPGLRANKCSNEVNPAEVAQPVSELAGTNQVPWLL